MAKMLLGMLASAKDRGGGSGGGSPPDEPPPPTAVTVANWRFNETSGTTLTDSVGTASGGWQGGAPDEFNLLPLTEGTTRSVGTDGTSYATATATVDLRKASYARSGYFQPDTVATGVQQVIFAQDEILDAIKPPGGLAVELFENRIGAYTRDAAGADKWLTADGTAIDSRPSTAPAGATVTANQAFVWMLEVEPAAVAPAKPTRLWVWKAGGAQPTDPVLTSENTVGLNAYVGTVAFGAYHGGAAPCDGVLDQFWAWNGAPGAAAFGGAGSGKPLTLPTSIDHSAPPVTVRGIQIPNLTFQTISDSAAGGVWWNPSRSGAGGPGDTKVNAYKAFSDAEAAASTTKPIILAGGFHSVSSPIRPTKSGASSTSRMKLFAEPNTVCVLVGDGGDFKGGADRSWTWEVIDAGKKIYRAPVSSFGDGATTINRVPGGEITGSNWIEGILEIPNGPFGKTWFMKLPFVTPSVLNTSSTSAGGMIAQGNNPYPGPCVCFDSNGRILVRLQPPTAAFASSQWPTTGIMGGLISSSGTWREPSGTANDYRIHLYRVSGEGSWGDGGSNRCFDFRGGVDHWHIKGVNTDSFISAIEFGGGCSDIVFERSTRISARADAHIEGSISGSIAHDHCISIIGGDPCHIPWKEYKAEGGYWDQKFRSALVRNRVLGYTATMTYTDCVSYGPFDLLYLSANGGPSGLDFVFNHCAFLNTLDDGMSQDTACTQGQIIWDHCFSWGGPPFSGGGGSSLTSDHWYIHHSIIDVRRPFMWVAIGDTTWPGVGQGLSNAAMTPHQQDSIRPMKLYYNTILHGGFGEKEIGAGATLSRGSDPKTVPSSHQQEAYNNIVCCWAEKIYSGCDTTSNDATNPKGDAVLWGMNCSEANAGVNRYDGNCYHRRLNYSTPVVTARFVRVQNFQGGGNRNSYNSLSDFKNNNFRGSGTGGHYNMSSSMYLSGTGGFGANRSGIGPKHEDHGVERDPGFVDVSRYDYRPTDSIVRGATGGQQAINLTASGWPGSGTYHAWRGACDPDGDGSDVGPRP